MQTGGRVFKITTLSFAYAAVAFAQGSPPVGPVPAVSLNPWGWVLEAGVPGLLLAGFVKLWTYFNEKDRQHQVEKAAWADEKAKILAAHVDEKAKLADLHEKAQDKVWEEARRDKADLRNSFEHDRSAGFLKLESMQSKLEKEQVDRREEAERLLREHTTLTREIVVTAQAMSSSLQENSRTTAELVKTIQKGG